MFILYGTMSLLSLLLVADTTTTTTTITSTTTAATGKWFWHMHICKKKHFAAFHNFFHIYTLFIAKSDFHNSHCMIANRRPSVVL